ncbi:indolepyruvate/phenylpyruvate decarboxylase [Piscinibacter terrae]|uniref:Indolepyruvate/phenylpyruvate decarboxylase n=1 Tax=Piscinibacter terrae TaxID=2496871 RepID=A0A3N7JP96_9BURK|nr:indolepyruvate/phenylpyruvate decarboxylase [Albitalea terrae]RQP22909.1 indolepyruvate/phenylpyruvate decarboxylase [Albitalea terrae]
MNLTDRLLQALAERGATEIFGIPGDFALPLFREIERSATLPLYTLSHEPGVGFAADAAARYRGGLGVAAVTYGAGAFNLVNAVAGAYAERVPLVVLSGAPAAHEAASGLLLHHQVKTLDSQWRVFEELTADRARLDDARQAPQQIARVLDTALRESRPVYLEIPRDMPQRPCDEVPVTAPHEPDPQALAACADELLERLRRARRPVLMVGVEVRRYGLEAKVATLARRLGIPVVTSFMGRGLLADADVPLLRGTYLGLAGDPVLSQEVETSDGLLLLGVIVSDTNFAVSAQRIDLRFAIQALGGRVVMGHHVYPDVPLSRLIDALLERVPATAPLVAPLRALATKGRHEPRRAEPSPVTPADIADAVNRLMQRHGPMPIACDVGDCLFTAMDIDPTALIAPGYYATMGYGVPAALGLQAATGQRPIVLVGDGAFQMTGWELGNAQRHGWDPIVIVFNNAGWEMLRAFEPEARFNDLSAWDFAQMAPGMGGDGARVEDCVGLEAALERAWGTRGRFQLIDVRLAQRDCSPTLQRFVGAVRRLAKGAAG